MKVSVQPTTQNFKPMNINISIETPEDLVCIKTLAAMSMDASIMCFAKNENLRIKLSSMLDGVWQGIRTIELSEK